MDLEQDNVQFQEDRTYLSPLPQENIPEKSIEGWIYKKVPGSIAVKRFALVILIIILFILSAIFFLLARSNQ